MTNQDLLALYVEKAQPICGWPVVAGPDASEFRVSITPSPCYFIIARDVVAPITPDPKLILRGLGLAAFEQHMREWLAERDIQVVQFGQKWGIVRGLTVGGPNSVWAGSAWTYHQLWQAYDTCFEALCSAVRAVKESA